MVTVRMSVVSQGHGLGHILVKNSKNIQKTAVKQQHLDI